jgi:dolichol-phosphate mannosyltransferase
MKAAKRIAIISPAANEEATIKQFVLTLLTEIKKLKIHATIFIIVDNASTDNTIPIVKQLSKKHKDIELLYEPKNRNVVDAYIRGFHEAVRLNYDYIIEMDCGFSHLPSELTTIIIALGKGYECVFGIRPLTSLSYSVPFIRRVYSLGGTVLSNFLLGMHYKDTTSGFNGYQGKVLKKLITTPFASTGNFWHTELRYRARHSRYTEVMITYTAPSNRVNRMTIANSFSVLFTLSWKRITNYLNSM